MASSTSSILLFPILTLLLQATSILSQTYSCTDIAGVGSDWSGASRTATTSSQLTFTTINTDDDTAQITLTNTLSEEGLLCTLFEVTTSDPDLTPVYEYYVPVGRSYDGRDWETVAGKHSTLVYTCSSGSCSVTLPDVSEAKYYMSAYKYTLTGPQSWARFMEKATFGPTTQAIAAQSGDFTTTAMASWIATQVDTPPSSHRQYFRRHLNPRQLEVYKYGVSGPHACDSGSYWRKFAFTRKDKIMSIGPIKSDWPMMMHNVTLESRTVSGVTKWAWVYAGHVRTMMNDQPKYTNGDYTVGEVIPEGTYDVCDVDEFAGSMIDSDGDGDLTDDVLDEVSFVIFLYSLFDLLMFYVLYGRRGGG